MFITSSRSEKGGDIRCLYHIWGKQHYHLHPAMWGVAKDRDATSTNWSSCDSGSIANKGARRRVTYKKGMCRGIIICGCRGEKKCEIIRKKIQNFFLKKIIINYYYIWLISKYKMMWHVIGRSLVTGNRNTYFHDLIELKIFENFKGLIYF